MASVNLKVYKCLLKDFILTDMRLKPSQCLPLREYSNRPKLLTEINKDVLDSIERGDCRPKRHAGIIKNMNVTLPKDVIDNIHSVIKDHPLKTLAADGIKLNQYLHSRHLPCEEKELESKLENASLWVERKYNISSSDLTDEERQAFRNKYGKKIKNVFQQRTYSWKPMDYDDYQSKVYLVGRSVADYAVVNRVFQEMNMRLPNFKPKSLFDFGSGVGTVTWAAKNFWEDSLQEYFCVDSSAAMNDLASSVLKSDSSGSPAKGFFYRQFLPASHSLKYDVVVSAFSLFELPSLKARLETILNLWKKTQGYLVIIEQGTNAGFQIVNETRDFILEFCNNAESSLEHAAHVFAPCPHEKPCPRFTDDQTPCNFEVGYSNPFYGTTRISKERFSYIVLKKGSHAVDKSQWPRIVRQVLPRSKHVVCRMCTPAGKLQEVVFTASKHGKITYKCARASRWGDLLPISIQEMESASIDNEDETKSFNEKDQT